MAKTDNLGDFLSDIADAIRAKKGTIEPINAQDFSSEIASISGNGTPTPAMYNDVNFVDYDGTVLYSYSKELFLEMTELPELPTRDGLICQGWNYSLDDAQSYVSEYGDLMIGATYVTDDGASRLYIRVFTEGRKDVPLYINQSVSQGVIIDWGDGSALETIEGEGYVNTSHNYENLGDYVIRLVVAEGTMSFGSGESTNCIMGSTTNAGRVYRSMLYKVEIGNNVKSLGGYAFEYCHALKEISIPEGVTTLGTYALAYCTTLSHVTIPKGLTGFSTYTFRDSYGLSSISISQGVTSFSTGVFYYCTGLSYINIPSTVTSLGVYFTQYCSSLSALNIPKKVTSFGAFAFAACYGVGVYDFSAYTSVPSLGNINVFNNIQSDCVIRVPADLLETWKTATNWATYADKIIAA